MIGHQEQIVVSPGSQVFSLAVGVFLCSIALTAPSNLHAQYYAPFPLGEQWNCTQGNSTSGTHGPRTPNRYAFDFQDPSTNGAINRRVVAARSGKVIKLKKDSSSSGNEIKFASDANYVMIEHINADKTREYSCYVHMDRKNSSRTNVTVVEGQYVLGGQQIGHYGMTGYTYGHHLHFSVQSNTGMSLQSKTPWYTGGSQKISFEDIGTPDPGIPSKKSANLGFSPAPGAKGINAPVRIEWSQDFIPANYRIQVSISRAGWTPENGFLPASGPTALVPVNHVSQASSRHTPSFNWNGADARKGVLSPPVRGARYYWSVRYEGNGNTTGFTPPEMFEMASDRNESEIPNLKERHWARDYIRNAVAARIMSESTAWRRVDSALTRGEGVSVIRAALNAWNQDRIPASLRSSIHSQVKYFSDIENSSHRDNINTFARIGWIDSGPSEFRVDDTMTMGDFVLAAWKAFDLGPLAGRNDQERYLNARDGLQRLIFSHPQSSFTLPSTQGAARDGFILRRGRLIYDINAPDTLFRTQNGVLGMPNRRLGSINQNYEYGEPVVRSVAARMLISLMMARAPRL
jgi:hypothetical protein